MGFWFSRNSAIELHSMILQLEINKLQTVQAAGSEIILARQMISNFLMYNK